MKRIVLVEAPIDAVSYVMLEIRAKLDKREGGTIYLSTDGSGDIPVEQIRQAMDQGAQVVIAYDSTEKGSEHSKKAARGASDKVIDKVLTPQAMKVIEEGGEVLVVKKGREGQTLLSRAIPTQHKDWNEVLKTVEKIESAQQKQEQEQQQKQQQQPERRRGRSR